MVSRDGDRVHSHDLMTQSAVGNIHVLIRPLLVLLSFLHSVLSAPPPQTVTTLPNPIRVIDGLTWASDMNTWSTTPLQWDMAEESSTVPALNPSPPAPPPSPDPNSADAIP